MNNLLAYEKTNKDLLAPCNVDKEFFDEAESGHLKILVVKGYTGEDYKQVVCENNDEDVSYSITPSDDYSKISRIPKEMPFSVINDRSSEWNKDFYYESKILKSINSVAVGLINAEQAIVHPMVIYEIEMEWIPNFVSISDSVLHEWKLMKVPNWPNKKNKAFSNHAETGKMVNANEKIVCDRPLQIGDVIGSGVEKIDSFLSSQGFFTLNGKRLKSQDNTLEKDVTFVFDISIVWYPIILFIDIDANGVEIELNLGQTPFPYQPFIAPREQMTYEVVSKIKEPS